MQTQEFHSGRRLAKLRELYGKEQKQLSGDSSLARLGLREGFPCRVPKTISRWELGGIPTKEIKAVAQSFNLPLWVFVEKAVDEEMLISIAANPEYLPAYQNVVMQRRMQGQSGAPQNTPAVDATFSLWLQWLRQEDKAPFSQEKRPFLRQCDHQGWSLLHWAVYLQLPSMVEFFLAQNGAAPDLADSEGYTALMCAAHYGQLGLVQTLLAAKAQVDLQDQLQWTALAWAAGYGHQECAEELLTAGANPDLTDLQGVSPLNRAVAENKTELALLLLEQGANPLLPDDQGHQPLYYAQQLGQSRLAKQLAQRNALGTEPLNRRRQWAG